MRVENRCRRVYFFDDVEELLKKVDMDKLIAEKFAEYPEDNFWAEPIEEDFRNIMEYFGFSEVETCWDVSYSQGSGASFEGSWCADEMDYKALKTYAPQDSELLSIFKSLENLIKITCKDCECFDNGDCHKYGIKKYKTKEDCIKDMRLYSASIVRCQYKRYCHEYIMCAEVFNENDEYLDDATTEDFLDICRELALWFRDSLKNALEYETSKENIAEIIVNNEIEIEEEYLKKQE